MTANVFVMMDILIMKMNQFVNNAIIHAVIVQMEKHNLIVLIANNNIIDIYHKIMNVYVKKNILMFIILQYVNHVILVVSHVLVH